jgi:HEAT repeat protein
MERYGEWPSRGRTLRRWARIFRGPAADREEAMLALMEAGKPAVPFLMDLMTARNVETRADAAVALATMARGGRSHNTELIKPCPEALDALLAGVEDPDPLIRLHSVAVLDTHQVDGGRATPALRKAAEEDPDPTVREAAGRALRRRGGP